MPAAANAAHPPQHAATAPAANAPSSTASSTEAGRSNSNNSSIGGGDGVSGSGGEVEVSNAENGVDDLAVDGSDNEPRVIEVKIQLPGKATEPIVLPVRWHAAMPTRTRSLTHVLATISAVGAACCHVHTFRKECAAVFPSLSGLGREAHLSTTVRVYAPPRSLCKWALACPC
jgi:hypothetical protein